MKLVFCLYLLLVVIPTNQNKQVPSEFIAGIVPEFNKYDQDMNGLLNKEQLYKLVEAKLKEQPVNVPGVQLSQKFYKQAIVSYLLKQDKNKDGLSVHQFEQVVKKQYQKQNQTQQGFEDEGQEFAL